MYIKLLALQKCSFDDNAKRLLKDSYIKFMYGVWREVAAYAQPADLIPWLRNIIEQDRSIYPEALALFPDNQFWNDVFNIKTISLLGHYREQEVERLFYEKKEVLPYGPSAADSCACIYNKGLLTPEDILLDIGSGEGAFLAYSAVLPLREIIGVEIRPELYKRSLDNLARHQLLYPQTKITLCCDDVLDRQDLINRATVFYLLNPVGKNLLKKILNLIEQSLKINPRKIKFIYSSAEFNLTVSRQKWLSSARTIKADHIYFWESL